VTPGSPARILVVEDEEAIAEGLATVLRREGHLPTVEANGRTGLERARAERFDLILLDVRLPEMDGFEVCQRLRQGGDFTPILLVTARNQSDDVVYGLSVGADDYVVKPFDLNELLARVASLLRRQGWTKNGTPDAPPSPEGRFVFGDHWIDFGSYQAHTRQGVRELTQKEIAVMRIFASRPNQVIRRRELLAAVWELPDHPNERVVDNVILSLRKAFEESSWRPRHLHSVRGAGYRFTP
jgi:DNA-binding response OmpR family regulator